MNVYKLTVVRCRLLNFSDTVVHLFFYKLDIYWSAKFNHNWTNPARNISWWIRLKSKLFKFSPVNSHICFSISRFRTWSMKLDLAALRLTWMHWSIASCECCKIPQSQKDELHYTPANTEEKGQVGGDWKDDFPILTKLRLSYEKVDYVSVNPWQGSQLEPVLRRGLSGLVASL